MCRHSVPLTTKWAHGGVSWRGRSLLCPQRAFRTPFSRPVPSQRLLNYDGTQCLLPRRHGGGPMRAMILKEFRQMRRDRRTLALMLLVPGLLLTLFGYAARY